MRLVVIDAKAGTYSVYEGRRLVASFRSVDGEAAWPEQIEAMRTADLAAGPAEERAE